MMYENGFLNLDRTLGEYMPLAVGTNKANLIIREILAHQAMLYPWIPFYRDFLDENSAWKTNWISGSSELEIEIARDVYGASSIPDSVLNRILSSDLLARKQYRYSDL